MKRVAKRIGENTFRIVFIVDVDRVLQGDDKRKTPVMSLGWVGGLEGNPVGFTMKDNLPPPEGEGSEHGKYGH
jgi:hypothetical protein